MLRILFTTIVAFSTLFATAFAAIQPTCHILALSGGGSFGAVEVGILDTLTHQQRIPPTFDLITGISAGGLNAAVLSYHDTTIAALPLMVNMYTNLRTAHVYYTDLLHLQTAWSIFNTAPLEATLRFLFHSLPPPKAPPRTLIGASNLYTDALDIFDFHDLPFEDQIDVLMSTTAIPVVFPPRKYNGTLYIDGGLISNEIITEAMAYRDCAFYNVTFISARAEHHVVKPTTFLSYVKTVLQMLLQTFDSELSHRATCPYPKGEIRACYPTDEALANYSVLDFDHGQALYQSGKDGHECLTYMLC